MSSSTNHRSLETIEYSDEEEDQLQVCSWMTPGRKSEETNTCFMAPTDEDTKASDQRATMNVVIQSRGLTISSEKMKKCEFSYLPAVLFGKEITFH